MKKRLRKKKRIDEFQESGFEVRFHFSGNLSVKEQEELFDGWIGNAVEQNDLLFGGGFGNGVCEGFVTVDKARGSATEQHRQVVEGWVKTNPKISSYTVGLLVDAWYGW